jgi:hypothetical protein
MGIKRWGMLLITMFAVVNGLYAQEVFSDSIKIAGEWKLVKIESQLLAQEDDHLLEEKTIIITNERPRLRGFVPFELSIAGKRCRISSDRGVDDGEYLLDAGNTFSYEGDAIEGSLWHIDLQYRFVSDVELIFIMPAAQFKDSKRNLAVKQVNKCYYRKAS